MKRFKRHIAWIRQRHGIDRLNPKANGQDERAARLILAAAKPTSAS